MRYPPLNTLIAFESAARLGSFSCAGTELHLTHGAVSRQIASLERHLGVVLFERQARGVRPTAAGQRFHVVVRSALAAIELAAGELREHTSATEVRVSITPSFGARWLMPRLAQFNATHPNILLTLDADLRLADLSGEGFDFGVRYGAGQWRGVDATLLLRETLSPVCAPSFIAPGMADLNALLALPLLHDHDHHMWRLWLANFGYSDPTLVRSTVLNDYNLVLEAAGNGLGVAMGRSVLVADELARKRLVEPLPLRIDSPYSHYLTKPTALLRPAAQTVWDWFCQQAGVVLPTVGTSGL